MHKAGNHVGMVRIEIVFECFLQLLCLFLFSSVVCIIVTNFLSQSSYKEIYLWCNQDIIYHHWCLQLHFSTTNLIVLLPSWKKNLCCLLSTQRIKLNSLSIYICIYTNLKVLISSPVSFPITFSQCLLFFHALAVHILPFPYHIVPIYMWTSCSFCLQCPFLSLTQEQLIHFSRPTSYITSSVKPYFTFPGTVKLFFLY